MLTLSLFPSGFFFFFKHQRIINHYISEKKTFSPLSLFYLSNLCCVIFRETDPNRRSQNSRKHYMVVDEIGSGLKQFSAAFCTVCCRELTICHGGEKDLTRHEGSDVHKKAVLAKGVGDIGTFFATSSAEIDRIASSEVAYTVLAITALAALLS